MGRTTDIAADRATRTGETVYPTEVVRDFHFRHSPSLAALKLFHLMVGHAAGRMADDTRHEIRLAQLRAIDGMRNHDRASLAELFVDLAAVVVRHGDPTDDAQVVTIGGLIEAAELQRPTAAGDALIWWRFGRMFRDLAGQSDLWVILDRQAVFNMQSKYSILLFQHISSYTTSKHATSKDFTVPEIRSLLGLPDGINKRFADLRRNVLLPAIAEINQLTRLELTATTEKTGRTATTVTIHWQVKQDATAAKRELSSSKVGRAARREGTAEAVVTTPAFPASGSIAYVKYWHDLKRATGCTHDATEVADGFRAFCSYRNIPLDAPTISDIFATYCAKLARP